MEHFEQVGQQSLTSMARLCSLVFITLVVDGLMVTYCLENIPVDQASSLVLFAFGELLLPFLECVCTSLFGLFLSPLLLLFFPLFVASCSCGVAVERVNAAAGKYPC